MSAFATLRRAVLIVLPLLALATLTAGCDTLRLRDRRISTEQEWNTDGASARRQYATDELFNPPLTEVWSYNANAAFGPGSALLSSGVVTVGTRKGELHMVDVETGKRIGLRGFGDAIEAAPVLVGGTVFVPVAWGKGGLYAYNLYDGRTLWKRRDGLIEAGLLHTASSLIAVETGSKVLALDPRTGEAIWERQLNEAVGILAAPVQLGSGRFAVVDEDGLVTALNEQDGAELWTASAGSPVRVTPSSVGETLFLATTRGRLVAMDAATGGVRWRHALPDTTVYLTSPAATERDVVVGGSDGKVRSFDAHTGALEWTFDAEEAISGAPLITAEAVYVGSLSGKLYGLDRATGSRLWEHELDGRIKSALAAHDGYLVALSEPRTVHLFKRVGGDYADAE